MAKDGFSARTRAKYLAGDVDETWARRGPTDPHLEHHVTPTISYLERVRTVIALERRVPREQISRYAIAKKLGVAPNRLSLYYVHRRAMDNRLAYNVATLLGEPPLRVIAEIEASRSARADERTSWSRVAQTAGKAVALIAFVVAPFTGAQDARAAFDSNAFSNAFAMESPGASFGNGIHIVRQRRRPLWRRLLAWLGVAS